DVTYLRVGQAEPVLLQDVADVVVERGAELGYAEHLGRWGRDQLPPLGCRGKQLLPRRHASGWFQTETVHEVEKVHGLSLEERERLDWQIRNLRKRLTEVESRLAGN